MPKPSLTNVEQPIVLLAASPTELQHSWHNALAPEFKVVAVASAHAGEKVLAIGGVAVVVCATELEDMPGLEWLAQLRRRQQPCIRVFAPTQSTEALAITAINQAGVFRYVVPAETLDPLRDAVAAAIDLSGHRSGPACMRDAVGQTIKAHSHCAQSDQGCLVELQQTMKPLPDSFLRRLGSQMGWTGMGILSLSVFLGAGFFMGIGVLTLLYIIKSLLGIDLIPDWSLTDWFH